MIKKQGIRVYPRSIKEIRKLASAFRGFQYNLRSFPIVEFLELIMPQLDNNFVLEIVDDIKMGNKHGLTYPDYNTIKIKESVYKNACNGVGRDRYTLAHELGHLLLHKNVLFGFAKSEIDNIPAYEDSEWQADTFAAELLMPFEQARSCRSPEEIANIFNVSKEAAEVRWDKIRKELKKQIYLPQ